jgi:hypothetical protein
VPSILKARFRWGPTRVQIPRNQFGLIWSKFESLGWTLPWTLDWILILQIMSSSFLVFFYLLIWGSNQLIFLPKWCHVGLDSIATFWSWTLSSQGHGSNLWLSFNSIGLLYFIGPSTFGRSKVTLSILASCSVLPTNLHMTHAFVLTSSIWPLCTCSISFCFFFCVCVCLSFHHVLANSVCVFGFFHGMCVSW